MPKKQVSARSATQVDFLIARRLLTRRAEVGLSQSSLADLVGITFQQIQKYEKGTNRIAASRLFEIARALDVPLSYFFEPAKVQAAKTKKRPAPKAVASAMNVRA